MRTVQMTLDDDLVIKIDKVVKEMNTNRTKRKIGKADHNTIC